MEMFCGERCMVKIVIHKVVGQKNLPTEETNDSEAFN